MERISTLWIAADGKVYDNESMMPYSSIDELYMLESRSRTYYMASTKLQFSYLLDYGKRTNTKITIKAADANGNIYSMYVGRFQFRSVDYIFNKPYSTLIKEFELRPAAYGVEDLVNMIEEAGQPFSFINKDYLTISKLAILQLQEYMPIEYFHSRYPIVAEQAYRKEEHDKKFYRGGINFLNERFKGQELTDIYKYDKNSYFAYVMKYGNMPIGHKYLRQGQPDTDNDVLVHVRLTGSAKFPGIYPYKDKLGNAMEQMIDYDEWIWIDELRAYEKFYDFCRIEYIEYYKWMWNKPEERFGMFVDDFFELKKQATGVKRYFVKRILNGAYGKLGQSPMRSNFKIDERGELFTNDKTHISYQEKYNIYVASKITALARAWLLNDIYEATHGRPDLYFVYCDTDSMMLRLPLRHTGDGLGEYKDEGPGDGKPWPHAKFLGCKCYMLYDGTNYECHAAGVNRTALEREIAALDWNAACRKFSYGETFMIPLLVKKNGVKVMEKRPRVLKSIEEFDETDATWDPVAGLYVNKE